MIIGEKTQDIIQEIHGLVELSLLEYLLNMGETGYSIKEKAEAHLGWMMHQKVKAHLSGSYLVEKAHQVGMMDLYTMESK